MAYTNPLSCKQQLIPFLKMSAVALFDMLCISIVTRLFWSHYC